MFSAVGAIFAQRAAKRTRVNTERLSVPTPEGDTRDLGPVVGKMAQQLDSAAGNMMELKDGLREIGSTVQHIQLDQARHEGKHEGMADELRRLARKVDNGGGR